MSDDLDSLGRAAGWKRPGSLWRKRMMSGLLLIAASMADAGVVVSVGITHRRWLYSEIGLPLAAVCFGIGTWHVMHAARSR